MAVNCECIVVGGCNNFCAKTGRPIRLQAAAAAGAPNVEPPCPECGHVRLDESTTLARIATIIGEQSDRAWAARMIFEMFQGAKK